MPQKKENMKIFRTILNIIFLAIQGVLLFFVFQSYFVANALIPSEGIGLFDFFVLFTFLFTTVPVFGILLIISFIINISILIKSLFRIRKQWWLLLIELAILGAHLYLGISFYLALKG